MLSCLAVTCCVRGHNQCYTSWIRQRLMERETAQYTLFCCTAYTFKAVALDPSLQSVWTLTSLVCQQIDQPAQFFRDGACSHNCARDVFILHDHPPVGWLPHVQVYTQATHGDKERCNLSQKKQPIKKKSLCTRKVFKEGVEDLFVVFYNRRRTITSCQRTKRITEVPDGDNVGEKHDESEKVAEPRTHKSLQCYHDDRQNHLGEEQGLGEAVQLQVQEANLPGREVRGQNRWKIDINFTFFTHFLEAGQTLGIISTCI